MELNEAGPDCLRTPSSSDSGVDAEVIELFRALARVPDRGSLPSAINQAVESMFALASRRHLPVHPRSKGLQLGLCRSLPVAATQLMNVRISGRSG